MAETVVLPQQNRFAPLAGFFQNLNIAREKKGFGQDIQSLQQFLLEQQQSQSASQQLAAALSIPPGQRQGLPGINFPAAPQFPQAQSQQGGQLFGNLLLQQQQQQGALGLQAARPVTGFRIEKQLIDDPTSPTKFSVIQRNQRGEVIGTRTATPKEIKEGVLADVQTGLSAKDKSIITISQAKEFREDSRVKDIRIVEKFTANVESVYQRSLTSQNLGPIDITLAKSFQKLTDLGSSVREGEFLTTFQGSRLLNKIRGKLQAVLKGGLGFTPEERKEIRDVTLLLRKDSRRFFNEAFDEFSIRADEFGLNKRGLFGGAKKFDISESNLTSLEQTELDSLIKERDTVELDTLRRATPTTPRGGLGGRRF